MFTNSKLAKSVKLACAFGAASAALTTTQVVAQEAGADEPVEKIQVTGSRIKRTDMESASPISVFTSADIEASGVTTLEDFVQNVPAINGAKLGSTVNNGNRGFATASLRGLGSGRTLVLINGRRWSSGDLNAIPVSIIERVEIVRDGASTVYGSDAIAGVINFITKKDFEGVELTAQYDVTDEDDGETTKIAFTTGTSSDKGNVVLSMEYTNRNAIWQGDRDFSACPLFDNGPGSEPFCGGSGTIPQGHAFPVSGGSFVVENGEIVPFSNAQHGYNYAAASYMVTPQEVFSANGSANYEIADSLSVFTEFGMANRQSEQLMAPVGTFWFPLVPESNPGAQQFGEDVYVARRLAETGGRRFTQDVADYRMVVGFEGYLSNDWTWDVSYNYSRFVDTRMVYGQANEPRFDILLDPELCADTADCPGVWNPFEAGTLTDEMIDYATVTHSPVLRTTTKQFMANLQGDLGDLELPGGRIMWAAGVEKRWESLLSEPDGAASLGQIFGVASDRTEGQYEVEEFYLEANFPILDGAPMAESLNVTAAVRRSDFDFLDDATTNTKFGVEWVPVTDLLVRATWAEGFRAPSISELFLPEQDTNPSYADPCVNWGTAQDNATIRANCQADGLPEDFSLSSNQASAKFGGNENLSPEESESFTAGVVWSHESSFTMAFDYFDIEIENGIGTAGVNNIVTGCYASEGFSSPLCDLIKGPAYQGDAPHPTSPRRNVIGNPSGVLLTNANLAVFKTSGVDFDFGYGMEAAGGEFKFKVNGTWLNEYKYTPFAGADEIDIAGTFATDQWEGALATFNEWKVNVGVNFMADDYSVAWESRWMSETDEFGGNPEQNLSTTADAIWYHDLSGSYYMDNYTFTAGVRNLLDEDPPYTTNNGDMNTINYSYDTAGRYFFARVTAKF
ncbi:TonB-dependent receptor [Alteromonas sp. ASW11-19]|uniref:TonB-dependent receptor n=1 Tax=Alteromonas salexigens TaxID=2982530 RepID=A0ABT2VP35_9ALTE|nr:TonB-dependent receptor [Alteromonas salexigens]MCU7555080.1 TonB-dependent receptor [Alteromonas salexigens]